MCVIHPWYMDYKHVLCNFLRHVKHQNKPFATSSFSVNDIFGILMHIIFKQNTVLFGSQMSLQGS